MTPTEFIEHWEHSPLNESQGAQIHFFQLCDLLGVAKPTGTSLMDGYGFEINVDKVGGGAGYADCWKRNCFAWEYKSPGSNLANALKQLKLYASDLQNPPLLIVSDMRRIELHTNWTNMVQEKHVLELADLANPELRQKLKWAFDEETLSQLRPKRSANATTEEVAKKFVAIAQHLRDRRQEIAPGVAEREFAEKVAHFVNRMVFCMFAEDVDLLPNQMFQRMLEASLKKPSDFVANATSLFSAMANQDGRVGYEAIDWFNGGLFEDSEALPLTEADIRTALDAARQNWAEINPSIMGTLFERGLDPGKRSQLGAHYTDAEKIMKIVRPVIIEPLLREWEAAKPEIADLLDRSKKHHDAAAKTRIFNQAKNAHQRFIERLASFRVLDPACGSGNFLFLALKALKDIEFRVNFEAEEMGLPVGLPQVGPECARGIEINQFAAELARVSVWIGEIQWMRQHNLSPTKNPILKPLETIECRDALLQDDGSEAKWPEADVIIGNPPFLGGKLLRDSLSNETVERMFAAFDGRVPREADLVCYWFRKGLDELAANRIERVGLVATNSIRGGANRGVLDQVRERGVIFNAWDDEPWVVEGASVRVAIICFAPPGDESPILLDGMPALEIYSNLTARRGATGVDLTTARRLAENGGVAFMGDTKGGAFDISGETARQWLQLPRNPNGRPNSDVLKPWINGLDVSRRPRDMWIIDFGWQMSESEAALFEAPFSYVHEYVKPERQKNRREAYRANWWRHVEPRQGFFAKVRDCTQFIGTARVAKHRLWIKVSKVTTPDSQVIAVARDDDTTFGILHSKFHELWSLRLGTSLEDRPRYTPTTCFETFPFPEGLTPNTPATQFTNNQRAQAIARAAERLNELRNNWLNPPDLVQSLPEVVAGYPDRIMPVDKSAADVLKDRTLTKLYNERPAWLDNAHRDLDDAVAAAYGWPTGLNDDQILERLFQLNQERSRETR